MLHIHIPIALAISSDRPDITCPLYKLVSFENRTFNLLRWYHGETRGARTD